MHNFFHVLIFCPHGLNPVLLEDCRNFINTIIRYKTFKQESGSFRVILSHQIYLCTQFYCLELEIRLKVKAAFHRIKCRLASLSDLFLLLSSVELFLFFKWHSEGYFKPQCISSSCYQQSRNYFYKREYFLIFRNSLA